MPLNIPEVDEIETQDIVENRLYELLDKLHKEGFKDIEIADIEYTFLDRVENLYIQSEKLYPNEDLPDKFGVQRGYAGGGMHSGLGQTEFQRMTKSRQNKAERVLGYFRDTFWAVLKDFDNATSANVGEEIPEWDKVSI